MKVTLLESITTEKGIIYPKGYVFECDGIVGGNLVVVSKLENDRVTLATIFIIGLNDFQKIKIELRHNRVD